MQVGTTPGVVPIVQLARNKEIVMKFKTEIIEIENELLMKSTLTNRDITISRQEYLPNNKASYDFQKIRQKWIEERLLEDYSKVIRTHLTDFMEYLINRSETS
jgi:hypothetical protein